MLQTFRERMQGIIAWTIVVAICITFALWGIQNYLHGDSGGDYVAKVNGTKITQKKLMTSYEVLRKTKVAQLGADFQFDQASQLELKKQALSRLIKEEVLIGSSQKMGLYVSIPEVFGFINELPQFQSKGTFSPEKFSRFINMAYNGDQREFVAEIQKALMFTQLEVGIRSSQFALPNEIDTAYQLKTQTRDFGYYLIDSKRFIKDAKISEKEIADYYNKNKDKFSTQDQVSIEYLQLSVDDLKNNFTGKKSAGKDKANDARQQALQLYNDQYEKLSDLTYTNSDNLTTTATALGLPVKTSDLFTDKGAATGLAANKKVVKIAFSEQVLKQGYNSSPIEISNGNVVVIRIKQHIPKDVIPLVKVKSEIEKILQAQKAEELAKSTGQKLVADLQQKKSPASLAKQYNLPFTSLTKIGMNNTKLNKQILDGAFDLPNPANGEVSVNGIALTNGDYAVIVLNKIYLGNVASNDGVRADMQKSLPKDFGTFDYSLFTKGLMDKAKIKTESLSSDSDVASGDDGSNLSDDQ